MEALVTLERGTRVGPYEILDPLGAGGMGEVYRALDPRLGREVAIKFLSKSLSAEPDRLRRFEHEARAAGMLNHPNIVAVHDVGTHEGTPYVVTELLVGETLRRRLGDRAIPPRKAIEYSIQIAQGLAAAHDLGIVHRDLKPDNIFITKDGRVKIFDFGLAKLVNPRLRGDSQNRILPISLADTEPGVLLGTVSYMSPEQIRGTRADHRSDIFSFGLILYEMLAGEPAFQGETAVEVMHAILKNDTPDLFEVNPLLPPEFQTVIRHSLEKNPEERFQSARDVAFNLEALFFVAGKSAAMRLTLPRLFSRGSLVPLLIIGLLLAVVSLVSLLVGMQSMRQEPPSFQQLTFRRGRLLSARFSPDGHAVVFGGAFDGNPVELFITRPGTPEPRSLGLPVADILSISAAGEMAIQLSPRSGLGTLARAPLGGGTPREIAEQVRWADWAPDGRRLAAIRWWGGRNRLEFPVGRVLYETPHLLSNSRVSPQGNRLAFFEKPTGVGTTWSIQLIDLSGKRKILSSGWAEKLGLAWWPTGEEIWFVAAEEGSPRNLYAVTPAGKLRLVMRLPIAFELHDIAPDRRLLFSTEFLRTATLASIEGQAPDRDMTWLDGTYVSDLSRDGKTIVLTERGQAGGKLQAVYLRAHDGSPAVKLGDGGGFTLSPDGQWVLAVIRENPPRLVAHPTGVGVPFALPNSGIEDFNWANWLPDGKHVLFAGNARGKGVRLYVQPIAGGSAWPITFEGVFIASGGNVISPDGRFVAAFDSNRDVFLQPIAGGERIPLPGVQPGELPIQWSEDGKSIYVYRRGELPARVYRVWIDDQRRELVKEIVPPDRGGVLAIANVKITPDARSVVYTFSAALSELYVADGFTR